MVISSNIQALQENVFADFSTVFCNTFAQKRCNLHKKINLKIFL